ncbi:GntR family transcriptional regulator [Candidimonas nitroreducens]|uniref:GntR family transcriptional regulator n=1 Tax=Candidimonas nitroreducens TaxID=683354 RepID=A0A225MQS5_9BURK|nr:GntR family transcriptional regulator [Candidimonas nitroreducens]OWT63717.1 GntR family transcriptional regulator [Candidimonas nitroreducens]
MAYAAELDRYRQAAPQLYELLRDKIVSMQYLPGASLSRVQMSAEFRVSQTPVREALLRLAEDRLVDVFPQAATKVSLIDVSHAEETHFLRRAIELEIVRDLALHPDTALLGRLRTLLRRQAELRDSQNYGEFTETDQQFHCLMYEATGKLALWKLVRSRSGHIDRLRNLHLPAGDKIARIVGDHSQILEAMERGDAEAAQQHLRTHLSGTLESVSRIRADHPQYFAAQ